MKDQRVFPILQVLLAALFFGASAPLSKLLLGSVDAVPLAGFLYLGSGLGAAILIGIQAVFFRERTRESALTRREVPWLIGAIAAGGVAAPIILMLGLKLTPASTASMLLNFEAVGTALLAAWLFKEAIDRRVVIGIMLITAAGIALSWDGRNEWGFSLGALAIILACFLWGLDNNCTRHISGKNPLTIVAIKGFSAGAFSLILTVILRRPLPTLDSIWKILLLGAVSYGLSIYLFILSLRNLGAARTGALFGLAPFIGTALSLILFPETPAWYFWLAIPIMAAGMGFILTEVHRHAHVHEPFMHDHRHYHPEEHHEHAHQPELAFVKGWHTHEHQHLIQEHEHDHTPDIHHRHQHKR